jgi:hypothetical protein
LYITNIDATSSYGELVAINVPPLRIDIGKAFGKSDEILGGVFFMPVQKGQKFKHYPMC